jgi:hypothetical protein
MESKRDQSDWSVALDMLTLVDPRELTGAIIVGAMYPGPNATEEHWHLGWIPDYFSQEGRIQRLTDSLVASQRLRIISGMSRFWFTLSMIDLRGCEDIPALDRGWDFLEQIALPMLKWFMHWLPSVTRFLPRLAGGLGPSYYYGEQPGVSKHYWFGDCANLACECGYIGHPMEFLERVEEVYSGSILRALLEEGIVELANGHPVLRK